MVPIEEPERVHRALQKDIEEEMSMPPHPLVSHGTCSICHRRDMVVCYDCDSKLVFREEDSSFERVPIPHRINQLFRLANGELRCMKHVHEPQKEEQTPTG